MIPHSLGNDYAEKYFYISPEAKGSSQGPWESRPWQREVLNVFASPEYLEVSWRKASRMGASKMMVCVMTQAAVEFNFNCIMYHQDDKASDEFVKIEIDPVLRDMEVLQPLRLRNSKKYDTLDMKQLSGSVWHFLGGKVAGNFRAKSVDWVFNDEVSAFDRDIQGEGDGRALSRTRHTESPFGKQINVSSPKITGECLITGAIDEMDFLFKFYVPCPGCGLLQYLDFFEKEDRGIIWDFNAKGLGKKVAKTARYKCMDPNCGHCSTYAEMLNAQEEGQWLTEDMSKWLKDGRVYNDDGAIEGERWSIGLDSNIFISPAYSFSDFVAEYLAAKKKLDKGNVSSMKTLYNNRLARTWTVDKAIDTINYKSIKPIRYPADGLIPEGVVAVTSVVDVHADRLELGTIGWGEGEQAWWLEYEVIVGKAENSGVWSSLAAYWRERTFKTEDGRTLPIYLKGVDVGGHWHDRVLHFCRTQGTRTCLPIKGFLGTGENIAVFPTRPSKGVFQIRMNTDPAKTLIYRRLGYGLSSDDVLPADQTDEGKVYFPQPEDGRYTNFDVKFYKNLTSETKEIKSNGKVEWKQNGKNEPLDLFTMSLALITIAQLDIYGLKLDEIDYIPTTDYSRDKYDMESYGYDLNVG